MAFNRILIALDESPVAARALQIGGELAAALGAEVGLAREVRAPRLSRRPENGVPT